MKIKFNLVYLFPAWGNKYCPVYGHFFISQQLCRYLEQWQGLSLVELSQFLLSLSISLKSPLVHQLHMASPIPTYPGYTKNSTVGINIAKRQWGAISTGTFLPNQHFHHYQQCCRMSAKMRGHGYSTRSVVWFW